MSRWLIAHGRTGEATEILACIEDKPTTCPVVTAQLHEIQYSVDYERSHTIKWKDILLRRNKDTSDTKTLRRLLLGANTQLMQQFGGINIMSYYMPTVLINSVGLTERMARLLSACNAVSYLIFSSAAILLVERWGRRGLMLLSTAGQLLSFLVITILLRYAVGDKTEVLGSASVAFFFLYFISFGVGMLGVPWLYPTEVNSLPMRTKGAALATGTNWYVYCFHNAVFNNQLQDHKLHRCRNHTHWYSEPWMAVLDCMDCHERPVLSRDLLLLPRNW